MQKKKKNNNNKKIEINNNFKYYNNKKNVISYPLFCPSWCNLWSIKYTRNLKL